MNSIAKVEIITHAPTTDELMIRNNVSITHSNVWEASCSPG